MFVIPESTTEYGRWTAPGGAFVVEYSLPVFHEIDFLVSEAYRRIPHGGIEEGGLLFGYSEPRRVRIEVFRRIQCEHALGPSFKLSEGDVAALRLQVGSAASDPELEEMRLLGWFISHTRSDLSINDAELRLFNEIIPGAGKLTVLIKPEKFKPTLFAFLVRGADGQLSREVASDPIILPLTGRGGSKATAEIGSGEAPGKPTPHEPVPIKPEPPPRSSEDQISAVKKALLAARQMSAETPIAPTPAVPIRTPITRLERSGALEETGPSLERRDPGLDRRDLGLDRRETAPHSLTERVPLPSPPAWREDLYPGGPGSAGAPWANRERPVRPLRETGDRSRLQFTLVLLLSAALGCGLGYWAYLQLPPSLIPLDVRPEASDLLLSWPAEQTRDSAYAAIRVNDGEPMALSKNAKLAGQSRIGLEGDNVKVEIIAQHWMRNSRGIVRYVTPVKPGLAPLPVPMKTRPRPRVVP